MSGTLSPQKIDHQHWLIPLTDGAEEKTADGRFVARAVVMKSTRSQIKIKPDEARKLYHSDQAVEPYVRINLHSAFQQTSSIHSICLQRKARVVAGLGLKAVTKESERKYRQIIRKKKRAERETALGVESNVEIDNAAAKEAEQKLKQIETEGKLLRDWIESVGDDVPLREILERAWMDFESLGWFGVEVVRDAKGRPAQLVHIPAHLIRRTKDRERFIYLKSATQKVWFKSFGSEKHLNAQTGDWSETLLDDMLEANELLFWYQYSPLDAFYGVPGWFAAISEILGSNEARDFMLFYFTRRATPTYAVLLEGGAWGPAQLSAIRNFFRKDLQGDYHATLALEVPEGGKVTFERMTDEPRWIILVQQYLNGLRDAIVSAHGMFPALVGIIETAHLGAGTDRSQFEIFKSVEARPKQETLENLLNNLIVRKGLKIETQMLKLDELDVYDEQAEVAAVNILFSSPPRPTITLNEARKRLRYEPIDEEWSDEILVQDPQRGLRPLSHLEQPEPPKEQPTLDEGGAGDLSALFGAGGKRPFGSQNGNGKQSLGASSPTGAPQVGTGG